MSQMEHSVDELAKIDIVTMLMDFLRGLRIMWKAILLLAIIGALILGIYADRSYQPYYTASTTFTITIYEEQTTGDSYTSSYYDNAAAEQMARTFPYILTSGALQRRVAQALGVTSISGRISASSVAGSNLFVLSVRDTDPERAYATLQAVVENYPSFSEVIVGKMNMNILDETGVPKSPDNPKNIKSSVAKGAIAGMALGMVWVALVALSRKTIRREEDCIRFINHRCLGVVPFIKIKRRSDNVEQHINILDKNIHPAFTEAMRNIRNKIQRSAREHDLKVILVTSALAGEGKSTVAVNLALGIAQEGKSVALIDCDLRNPSDADILSYTASYGLVDHLRDNVPLAECMYVPSQMEFNKKLNFSFIPGGKAIADGSEYLASEKMRRVVETLKFSADYIILDSPPVGLLTDASELAQYADGAVIIVKKDFAKVDHILNGMEHLAEGNIHMIGCVLNGY